MVEPHWSLLQVLRGELGMTGTSENCLEAERLQPFCSTARQ